MIHFEHPWLQFLVKHDVEAKQLEATLRLFSLTATVNVLQLWLDSDNGLDNDGLNFIPNLAGRFGRSRFAFLHWWLSHDSFETVVQAKLVSIVIKLIVLLI